MTKQEKTLMEKSFQVDWIDTKKGFNILAVHLWKDLWYAQNRVFRAENNVAGEIINDYFKNDMLDDYLNSFDTDRI